MYSEPPASSRWHMSSPRGRPTPTLKSGTAPMVFPAAREDRCGMRRSTEVSRTEKRHLAVASATLGPWRTAAAVGAVGGGLSLALNTIGGDFGLGVLAGSLSVAMMLFFLVGGEGAVLGRGTGGANRRIRDWAADHPWQVAAVPASLMLVGDVVMRQILASENFFVSLWDGMWRAAVVAAVVGVVGSVTGSKKRG